MATTCEKYKRPILKAYDLEHDEFLLFVPRCKQWDCSYCAVINKLLWQAKIGHGYDWYIKAGIDQWNMVTITSHSKLRTFDQCLYAWPNQWAKLSARMRRKYPGFRYAILPECHKDGRVHWHMMASGNVKKRWLKDNAPKCGLGYMVTSEQIGEASACIGYVSKYISKSMYDQKWPRKLKRIRTSQKWPKLPPENSDFALDVDWQYWLTYPVEGLSFLAHELERETGVKTRILGSGENSG